MAAAVRMFAVAREEIPIVAGEIASTARASSSTSTSAAVESTTASIVRAGEKELSGVSMNPVAVRQMAEMSVKEGESSILGQHLSLSRAQGMGKSSSVLETISHSPVPAPLENHILSPARLGASTGTSTSIVAQTLEMDVGVSVKEAISNAGQTGVEEVAEQLGDIGKMMLEGKMGPGMAVPVPVSAPRV